MILWGRSMGAVTGIEYILVYSDQFPFEEEILSVPGHIRQSLPFFEGAVRPNRSTKDKLPRFYFVDGLQLPKASDRAESRIQH